MSIDLSKQSGLLILHSMRPISLQSDWEHNNQHKLQENAQHDSSVDKESGRYYY